MNEEIKNRFEGLESIIHGLHHNNGLMQFMSFGLHKEPFNLQSNLGLYWIWGNIMGIQILDFYKTIGKHEKFSFVKLINVAKENKIKVDYELIEKMTNQLIVSYEETEFETVRSKYLAHQDLKVPEIKTNLLSIDKFTKEIDNLFSTYSKEFKYDRNEISKNVVESFGEIFNTIDEYDRLKGYLIAAQIKGEETVNISNLKDIVNEK